MPALSAPRNRYAPSTGSCATPTTPTSMIIDVLAQPLAEVAPDGSGGSRLTRVPQVTDVSTAPAPLGSAVSVSPDGNLVGLGTSSPVVDTFVEDLGANFSKRMQSKVSGASTAVGVALIAFPEPSTSLAGAAMIAGNTISSGVGALTETVAAYSGVMDPTCAGEIGEVASGLKGAVDSASRIVNDLPSAVDILSTGTAVEGAGAMVGACMPRVTDTGLIEGGLLPFGPAR